MNINDKAQMTLLIQEYEELHMVFPDSREPQQFNRLEMSHNKLHKRLNELFIGHPTLQSFLAGSISGTCSTLMFQPLDLVKTRLQNAPSSSVTSIRIVPLFSQVLREESILGLWKGTTPSLIRCVPGVGLYFCSLNWLQMQFCRSNGQQISPSAIQAASFGLIARSFTGAVLIPVTVVKTRYESGLFSYKSVSQALRHTYASEGAKGLISGLMPTLMRDAPYSGIYYMFYSQLKNLFKSSSPSSTSSSPPPAITFVCGLASGLLASAVTHPADVIKTKMQLHPKRFPNIASTVVIIFNEKGLTGLFSGLLPRMIRRTLVTAMAWTVYEQIMKNVGLK